MGAWGTGLYSNDTAADIRGAYVEHLKRGRSNEEALQSILDSNKDVIGMADEEPLFWFALADTLWNYGRLTEDVKQKALSFLANPPADERWLEADKKSLAAWLQTLEKLKSKLLSEQPPEKKVSKYRLYRCPWSLGDVFAYRLEGSYAKEKGVEGKYIVFRKVAETDLYPGHIVPVVSVYHWMGDKVPSLDKITGYDLLPFYFSEYKAEKYQNFLFSPYFKLEMGRMPKILKDRLIFLGNHLTPDCMTFEEYTSFERGFTTGSYFGIWKKDKYPLTTYFDRTMIDQFLTYDSYGKPVAFTAQPGSDCRYYPAHEPLWNYELLYALRSKYGTGANPFSKLVREGRLSQEKRLELSKLNYSPAVYLNAESYCDL